MDTRPNRISNLTMLASEMESANPQAAQTAEETDAEAVAAALRELYPEAAVKVFDAAGAPGGGDLAIATKLMGAQAYMLEKEQQRYEKAVRKAARELEEKLDGIADPMLADEDVDSFLTAMTDKDKIEAARATFEARKAAASAVLSERQKTAKIAHDLAAGIVRNAKVRRNSELGTKPSVVVFGGVGSGRAAFALPVADDEITDES